MVSGRNPSITSRGADWGWPPRARGELHMAWVNRFKVGAAVGTLTVLPFLAQGCSSSSSNPLCCTEFKVGANIDANIGGSAQSQVAVQAVADIGGIASAAIDDLTTACRGIAQDLDTPQADQDTAEAN